MEKRAAIHDVSFTVNEGDILGFLGPNGAGKSTTMKILTCLMQPNSGSATVAGFDVRTHSRSTCAVTSAICRKNVPSYPNMIVRDYLHFVAEIKDVPRSRRRSRVDAVIGQCGLDKTASRLIGNLSKGYNQRVGLAQALVSDPPVLILDEPTSGLDPEQIVEIRSLIQSFAGDKTIILSTHILPEVGGVTCSRAVIIDEGRIIAAGPLDQIATDLTQAQSVFVVVRGDGRRGLNLVKGIAGGKIRAPE